MIIKRGERITRIFDDDFYCRLPTVKFDDIIGISKDILPEDKGTIVEKIKRTIFKFGRDFRPLEVTYIC